MTLKPWTRANYVFTDAYADALVCGIGIIKIANSADGWKMSHVPREEFMDLAKHLEFVTANTKDFTDKPTKG
jgi:hypothetical protein